LSAPSPSTLRAVAALEPPASDELLVVVGPTASGKTGLSIALSEALGGEVVGADSVQVYRRFDIGSGKPTEAERASARHHLIDIADADEPIDAARFARLADEAIADIRARGRTPIVCGGTFLWVKALLQGLAEGAPASPEIRERHRELAERDGRAALHAMLAAVDPASAARLNPNDLLRVSRALEVHELTGEPLSEIHARHQFAGARYRHRLIGLGHPREALAARIAARTDAWLSGGWLDEVRGLCDAGYGETRAMASVGYRQVREHLAGALSAEALPEAINRATRVFVRRQLTWLRDEPVTWLEP
jgi:tRNA dimethylallyltransferase